MKKLLTYTFHILISSLLISCGGGDGSTASNQQYIASIATDESDTTLDLYSTIEDNPELVFLESFSLGYGAMNYLTDQGSVPSWQVNVPDFCKNSANLGIDKVAPCVFAPLLQNAIDKYSAPKNIFSVTGFFNTIDTPQYSETQLDSLLEPLDTALEGYGYDAQIDYVPDPTGYYHNAYSHSESSGTDNSNWMVGLIESQTLKQLSLPGTHDTMLRYGGDIVQTQSMKLAEQLKSGIRALDIRCRHYDNHCAIHHGKVFQNANLDDVLTTVRTFLQSHPKEFVVMRVAEEYEPDRNTRSFTDTFKTYFDAYGDLFWKPSSLNDTQPTVEKMRGKVVVLQDWNSNVTNFGIQFNRNGSSTFSIQDHWEIRIQPQAFYNKWIEVDNQRKFAEVGISSYENYVNFLSASSYIHGQFGWPYFFASGKSSSGNDAALHLTGWTTPGWKKVF